MAYSNDEITGAVSSLVQGSLSFSRDRLGANDQKAQYDEVQELVMSALMYDPDSVFFLIGKAAKGLGVVNSAVVQLCDDLLEALDDLVMPDKPVSDVTSLSEAATALRVMQGALSRKGVVGSSEYSRYNSAVNRATQQFGRTTKVVHTPRGASQAVRDIVRSSSEAKTAVASNFKTLKTEHEEILERVQNIMDSYSEFNAANIAAVVGTRQLDRAATQMDSLFSTLDPKDPQARSEDARPSLLSVLANKSVVKSIRNRQSPGEPRVSQAGGAVVYRLSPNETGTPAVIEGNISAPWPIQDVDADELKGDYNGTVVTVDLVPGTPGGIQGIRQAELEGSIEGPYAVHDDIEFPYDLRSNTESFTIPTNGLFHLVVDGAAYECQLTSGTRTAAQIRTDLANAGNWSPSVPEVTFGGTSRIEITYNVVSPPASYSEREMRVDKGAFHSSSFWPWQADTGGGGWVTSDRSFGWNANNELWVHPNDYDDFDATPVLVDLPDGTFPDHLISVTDVKNAVDAAATAFSVEIEGDDLGTRVKVKSSWTRPSGRDGGEGSVIAIKSDGIRGSGARTGYGTPSYYGMVTLGFSEGQEDRATDISGQSVVKALNNDTSFQAEAEASVSRQVIFQNKLSYWFTGGLLKATMDSAPDPTGQWPAASEMKVSIVGGVNKGIYGVTSYTYNSPVIEIQLDRNMRGEGASIPMEIEVYTEHLKILSKVSDTTSKVHIQTVPSDDCLTVLGLSTTAQYGTVSKMYVEKNDPITGWKAFDLRASKLKVGDKVLDSTRTEVTEVAGIAELEDGLFTVSPQVSNATSYSEFSIESADYIAYTDFIEALTGWWNNLPPYEEDLDTLDRALNTILNSHPNRARVDGVYARFSEYRSKFTGAGSLEEVIDNFTVREASSVVSALKTLQDRGLDRARDFLIKGEFENFFNTNSRNSTYGGDFLDKAATVVVQDLNENSAAKGRYDADFVRAAGDWQDDIDPLVADDLEEELPDDDLEEYWPGVDEEVG